MKAFIVFMLSARLISTIKATVETLKEKNYRQAATNFIKCIHIILRLYVYLKCGILLL